MLLVKLWIMLLLAVICYFDIKQMIIPDICILLLLPAAICSGQSCKERLLAASAVWLVFLAAAFLCALLKSSVPMGMGDIKLFSAIGLISGASGLAYCALVSFLFSGLFSALLLLLKKVQKKDQIAFGPFIAVGYLLYLASTSAM